MQTPITPKGTNLPFQDFAQLEIRVGTIASAAPVANNPEMLQLGVDFGIKIGQLTILAAIAQSYNPNDALGNQVVAVINLAPITIQGITSQGHLLFAHDKNGKPWLILAGPNLHDGALVG